MAIPSPARPATVPWPWSEPGPNGAASRRPCWPRPEAWPKRWDAAPATRSSASPGAGCCAASAATSRAWPRCWPVPSPAPRSTDGQRSRWAKRWCETSPTFEIRAPGVRAPRSSGWRPASQSSTQRGGVASKLYDETNLHAEYVRTRDPQVRTQLVETHLGLAEALAARFANRVEQRDDIRQVALIGL